MDLDCAARCDRAREGERVQDIAPGRTIAGRYLLQERRLASADGIEVWQAVDDTLRAEVRVTLIPEGLPHADAAVDAARRVANVQDHRLVQILDIGVTDGVSWIVEEFYAGARTLIDHVSDNPLDGEQTRTVLGEAASALAVASRRGLHHLRLTPYSVLITQRGEVKVSGLGTVLALEGADEPPSERANLLDCLGLLALAYYALTTRWPLPREVPGIDAAPRVVGGVPAPSEIAAGVPADLDLLCRTTLNGQQGPRTPADLAADVAPWRPLMTRGGDESVTAVIPAVRDDAPTTQEASTTQKMPKTQGTPAAQEVPTTQEVLAAHDVSQAQVKQAAQARTPQAETPREETPHADATHADATHAASPVDAAPTERPRPSRTGGAVAVAEAMAGRAKTALGTFARAAADKAALARAEATRRRESSVPEAAKLAEFRPQPAPYEQPSPLFTFDRTEKPGSHSSLVLVLVTAIVVVAVTLSSLVVFRGFTGAEAIATPDRPVGSVASGTPGSSPGASTATPGGEGAGQPVAIVSGTTYDPFGDGSENNNYIDRAYDGDPATRWVSEQYYSEPDWGGSANRGVGAVFRMPKDTSLTSVSVDLGSLPESATLYVGNSPQDLASATRIGSVDDATGTVTIPVSDAPPSEYIYVWFTKAPRDGRSWRVFLHEIRLLG